jgi:hypothetical protein
MKVELVKDKLQKGCFTFNDHGLICLEGHLDIDYQSIDSIELKMNAYMYVIHIFSVWYCFYVELNMNGLSFEFMNDNYLLEFIDMLEKNNIKIIDRVGIKEIYSRYQDKVARSKYLERNLKKLPICIK